MTNTSFKGTFCPLVCALASVTPHICQFKIFQIKRKKEYLIFSCFQTAQ